MIRRFFKRSFSIAEEIQKQEAYYLVDYDFHEHKENRVACRQELLRVLGVKTLGERTSTTSVIPVETLEEALQLRAILAKHGAIVNVRECRTTNYLL